MPISVVLDTSVLIAGLHSPRGASYEVLRQIGSGAFELSVSVPLVLEYEAVAKRLARELGLTYQDVDEVVDYVCSVAQHRQIFYLWRPVLRDPRDDLVLELTVEAGAELIITHNVRDFAGTDRFGIEAVTPGEFLRRLRRIR
ncbi:MAG: putative toxin-antitoxin system toxin component, PIN family [Gemmatimonadaceae bacterium]